MGKRHSSTTFGTARAAWLDDALFRRLSRGTIREYARISGALLSHLADEVGREPTLDDLRPAVLRAWLNDRQPPLQPASPDTWTPCAPSRAGAGGSTRCQIRCLTKAVRRFSRPAPYALVRDWIEARRVPAPPDNRFAAEDGSQLAGREA
jgi:hypothetical protein